MYSLILMSALASPEQCSTGFCPIQRAVAVVSAPVQVVRGGCAGLTAGGCQGRSARFHAVVRGGCSGTVQARGGCTGQVSVVPKIVAPPLPMAVPPPPVVIKPPVEAPVVPVAASGPVGRAKVTVYRPAPVRTIRANRPFSFFVGC